MLTFSLLTVLFPLWVSAVRKLLIRYKKNELSEAECKYLVGQSTVISVAVLAP